MRHPDAQLRAGHRPAHLIPPGTHPGTVTIVQAPARSYAGPILLTITITLGTSLVIVILAITFQLAVAAAAAALPTIGGTAITIKLTKTRKGA
ncbi:hypothetical protein OYE22_16835 [Streptomyces sp. 71268]|uniref:hypothetical protein n=1 Tax=Streptomyces sp. 71268 TaxID=3002640 RepID=UPI0023F82ABE|nr:hypothetical protein [Streptomyces sp. 71268]WEV30099.1 hypothetical protein OYE22_16835 [Streptomyces sp. 71268]